MFETSAGVAAMAFFVALGFTIKLRWFLLAATIVAFVANFIIGRE